MGYLLSQGIGQSIEYPHAMIRVGQEVVPLRPLIPTTDGDNVGNVRLGIDEASSFLGQRLE